MNYLLHLLFLCELYGILALSMNLLAGYAGLISLAQAAFYGTGAYVTAILQTKLHFTFSEAIFCSIIFNFLASIPIILFATRLRDLFFIITTLAWQGVVFSVLYNLIPLTNGPFGITGIPRPIILGYHFDSLARFVALSSTICLLVFLFFIGFNRSPIARVLKGLRDDQLTITSFGKDVNFYKAFAILIANGVFAIAGALYATYFSYVDPGSFSLTESILLVSMVLIGGLGSLRGAIAGAMFYILLPEVLKLIQLPDAVAANIRMMTYAVTLLLVMLYRPYGFFGKYKF